MPSTHITSYSSNTLIFIFLSQKEEDVFYKQSCVQAFCVAKLLKSIYCCFECSMYIVYIFFENVKHLQLYREWYGLYLCPVGWCLFSCQNVWGRVKGKKRIRDLRALQYVITQIRVYLLTDDFKNG